MIYIVIFLLLVNVGLTLMLTVVFRDINITLKYIMSRLDEKDQL